MATSRIISTWARDDPAEKKRKKIKNYIYLLINLMKRKLNLTIIGDPSAIIQPLNISGNNINSLIHF